MLPGTVVASSTACSAPDTRSVGPATAARLRTAFTWPDLDQRSPPCMYSVDLPISPSGSDGGGPMLRSSASLSASGNATRDPSKDSNGDTFTTPAAVWEGDIAFDERTVSLRRDCIPLRHLNRYLFQSVERSQRNFEQLEVTTAEAPREPSYLAGLLHPCTVRPRQGFVHIAKCQDVQRIGWITQTTHLIECRPRTTRCTWYAGAAPAACLRSQTALVSQRRQVIAGPQRHQLRQRALSAPALAMLAQCQSSSCVLLSTATQPAGRARALARHHHEYLGRASSPLRRS